MADKELLERANLNELDRVVIRGDSFSISKQIGKHDVPSIRVNFKGESNYFSYSKYGLKQAKRWVMDKIISGDTL